MFSIAYFVTTTTCLSGANALKHKVNLPNRHDHESETKESGNDSANKLGKSAVGKSSSSKKHSFTTKRGSANDRKNINISANHKIISAGVGTKYSSNASSAHLIQMTS